MNSTEGLNDYYIYVTKDSDGNSDKVLCVVNMEGFAEQQFDPVNTNFTGVLVKAQNAKEAYALYRRPTADLDGEVYFVEEPEVTQQIRKDFNALKGTLSTLKAANDDLAAANRKLQAIELGGRIKVMFDKIEIMTRHIANLACEDKDVNVEEVFDTFITKFAEEFKKSARYNG